MNRKCILIIGNHRSGTSSLTGLIYNSLNRPPTKNKPPTELGDNSRGDNYSYIIGENIMKADEINKNGYFENLDIMKLNENIFYKMKSGWFDDRPLNDDMIYHMM